MVSLTTQAEASDPDPSVSDRIGLLADFCHRIEARLNASYPLGDADDEAMEVGFCRVGSTTNAHRQFADHLSNVNTNWLMLLFRAALQVAFPNEFQLRQFVIYHPHSKDHIGIAESVLSRLVESYIYTATGFSISPARVAANSAADVESERWAVWEPDAEKAKRMSTKVQWSKMFTYLIYLISITKLGVKI